MESSNLTPEDGFESGEEQQKKVEPTREPIAEEDKMVMLDEPLIKYIHPPQQIKQKAYSLHPDMLMGWAPKLALPKPIPLIFPFDPLSELLALYNTSKRRQTTLLYLGPRFDSTYSAWKVLKVEFPYEYMGNQRISITDRQFQGMNRSYSQPVKFDSVFESGNLDAVFEVREREFDCFMRVDANTRGHLHWYYFKMSNLQSCDYRINICNFKKSKTLYTRGMKPFLFSPRLFRDKKMRWHQGGVQVTYSKEEPKISLMLDSSQDTLESKYFTLSFSISGKFLGPQVQIAYCPPYTLTRLNEFIKQLLQQNQDKDIIQQDNLCASLGGLKIPILTISQSVALTENEFKKGKVLNSKKLVFAMGRLHPGEANGSYIIEEFIKWISGHSNEAQSLRKRYVFKVVPMVNPDGVVIGNYRTGLSGRDFNRQFIDPDKGWFVQVHTLKTFLQRCKWVFQQDFQFFLDFHGHSIKKNAFAYGPEFPLTHSKYYQSRLFPKLLSKRTMLFRYYSCIFKISPTKASTARAIALRSYGIPFTFTIEGSNGCYHDPELRIDIPFDPKSWKQLGQSICLSLYDYEKIMKEIEQQRERRKEERLLSKSKNKDSSRRRIHSSSLRRNSSKSQKKRFKPSKDNFLQKKDKSNLLQQILEEITVSKPAEPCSDDNFSQGKSDSESSQDDLLIDNIQDIAKAAIKRNKVKSTLSLNPPKKPIEIIKKTSFLTDLEGTDIELPPRLPPEKKKKPPFIRKKIYTQSGFPSPPRQPDTNSTAKVVNLSFIVQPIAVATSYSDYQKKVNSKKESQDELQRRKARKSQHVQSFRRAYLSLQRQTLKREGIKKIGARNRLSKDLKPFRQEEVVGKRIFTQEKQ